jgi:hypothetical protein
VCGCCPRVGLALAAARRRRVSLGDRAPLMLAMSVAPCRPRTDRASFPGTPLGCSLPVGERRGLQGRFNDGGEDSRAGDPVAARRAYVDGQLVELPELSLHEGDADREVGHRQKGPPALLRAARRAVPFVPPPLFRAPSALLPSARATSIREMRMTKLTSWTVCTGGAIDRSA